MKGRPVKDGDADHDRGHADRQSLPSMKGRPVKDGDFLDVHARARLHPPSMKGRPVKDGDSHRRSSRTHTILPSMKGRPVKDGDLGADRRRALPSPLNERPSRKGRRLPAVVLPDQFVSPSMKGRPVKDGDTGPGRAQHGLSDKMCAF